MTQSSTEKEERKTWTYAFIILALVSAWILATRLTAPFLAADFEIAVVYLPTVLAGIIALYLNMKPNRHG